MNIKKLISLATLLAVSGLYACGGGSGNGGTSSNERVVARVRASFVKGATVCVSDTKTCATTDANGTAILQVSKLPVTLVVKIADLTLGSVNASDTYVPITPLDLANNDNQTAQKLGALIHAIAGDTTGNSITIDLTNRKIIPKHEIAQPLVKLIKENKSLDLTVEDNSGNHTVVVDNDTGSVKFEDEPVEYDIVKLSKIEKFEKIAAKFVAFLRKYDRKTIALEDEEENGTCVLIDNPSNPLQFKFTDCSNPKDNDDNWENLFVGEDGAKAIDEDGVVSYVWDVDVKEGEFKYKYYDKDSGKWIFGKAEVRENEESDTYKDFLELIKGSNNKTIVFHENGKEVTCKLKVNPSNVKEVMITNCSNPDYDDGSWENVVLDNGKVEVIDEDNAITYILEVDPSEGTFNYKYEEHGKWINGWAEIKGNQSGSNEEENEEGEHETIINATKPFFPTPDEVKSFLKQYSGKQVKTSDGGNCTLTYEEGKNAFVLNSCSNTEFPQGEYKIYSTTDYPKRAFVKTPDNDDDVFFFQDNTTLCTSDGCIYTGDEVENAWDALGDWSKLDVAKNSPDLARKFCIYFGKNSVFYPKGDENYKLADYNVNGNEITFTNTDPDFDVYSMKVFKISNVNGKTYILTHTKWKDDKGLQIFELVNYCDNEDNE
jgi:hypothetical protein